MCIWYVTTKEKKNEKIVIKTNISFTQINNFISFIVFVFVQSKHTSIILEYIYV